MNQIKREILLASYWEHHKFEKELALIYPIDNPKRLRVQKEVEKIRLQLNYKL